MRVGLAASAVILAFTGGLAGIHHETNKWKDGLRPCVTEFDNNCYWDAHLHGNGKSSSFRVDEDGRVTYKTFK
jgi:hypothetical protein